MVDTLQVTKPGRYTMSNETYHADPVPAGSLSSSSAKYLLPPYCPAIFKARKDNKTSDRSTIFDIGHAAHSLILHDPQTIVRIEADSWRTKAVQEQKTEAYANGAIPLLAEDHDHVLAMETVFRTHPVASRLVVPGQGRPEQSFFNVDEESNVWLRARVDWIMDHYDDQGRLTVVDYKTTKDVNPNELAKSVHSYGYHRQAAWYLDILTALGFAPHGINFVFIFQMKLPPYLLAVRTLDTPAIALGRQENRRAINTYRQCRESGIWPGFEEDNAEQIPVLSLPAWAVA